MKKYVDEETIGGDSGLTKSPPEGQGRRHASGAILENIPDGSQRPGKTSPGMQRLMRASQFGMRIGPKRSTCEPGRDDTSLGAWQKKRVVRKS